MDNGAAVAALAGDGHHALGFTGQGQWRQRCAHYAWSSRLLCHVQSGQTRLRFKEWSLCLEMGNNGERKKERDGVRDMDEANKKEIYILLSVHFHCLRQPAP